MTTVLQSPVLVLASMLALGLFFFMLARNPRKIPPKGRGGDGAYPHAVDAGSEGDCGGDGGGD